MHLNKDTFTGPMFRRLFIPAMMSAIGLALSDMADAIVVGRQMGEVGLVAIGMSLPLYMVINVFMHGFGIGGSVRYAKLMSEGSVEEANLSFNRVMRMALIFSAALAAIVNLLPQPVLALLGTTPADGELYAATCSYVRIIALASPLFFTSYMLNYYLRNDDSAGVASAGFLIGNGTDIALNVLFVSVLGWGTAGAAWATCIGLCVTIGVYLPALFRKGHGLRILGRIRMAWKDTFRLFLSGFSSSSQYLWQMAFLLIANNTLMAHLGGPGVAVFDMLQNASYLIMYMYDAAGKALQPLASTFFGEKDMRSAQRALRIALTTGMAASMVVILLMTAFPGAVCSRGGLSEAEELPLGMQALRIYCLGACFAGVTVLLEGYYQAVDEEKCAFLITLLRGCVVLIPATVLLAIFAPEAFWWVFPITEAGALILFLGWRRVFHKPNRPIDPARVHSCTLHSRMEDIGAMTAGIEAFCEAHEANMRQQYFVTMAAEEISLAIMNGGFKDREDGVIHLTLIALEDGMFELHIRDNAASFDPFSLETAKVGEGGFDMDAMGMAVIKKQAKYFYYRHYQGFNSMVMKI